MSEPERHTFESDQGSTTLTPWGERVRLNIGFPDGNAWVDWRTDEARAVRDGLTTWLDAQDRAREDGGLAR